jgi:hypothetical protein
MSLVVRDRPGLLTFGPAPAGRADLPTAAPSPLPFAPQPPSVLSRSALSPAHICYISQYKQLQQLQMHSTSRQNLLTIPLLLSSSLYSSMTWIATNNPPHASAMNRTPSQVPTICRHMYAIPSVPIANPIRLAVIIISTFATPPSAARCRYHQRVPYCERRERQVSGRNEVGEGEDEHKAYPVVRHDFAGCHLWEDEEADDPSPGEELEAEVVP